MQHSTKTPASLDKAVQALAALRMPAIAWMTRAIDQASRDTCPLCGFPSGSLKEKKRIDMLAMRVSDRTGLAPKMQAEITHKRADIGVEIDVEALLPAEREEFRGILDRMRDFRFRIRSRLNSRDPAIEAAAVPEVDENEAIQRPAIGDGGESPVIEGVITTE